MDISERKQMIKSEIDKIEDEKLLWALERILHLEEDVEIPDWHQSIVMERLEKYKKGEGKYVDWDDIEKSL